MTDIKKEFQAGLDTIKTLTGISQADFDTLREISATALPWTDEIVQVFYDTLFAHARTAAVFHAGERPAREDTLREWYKSIFNEKDSQEFWLKQGRIGFAHIRRRVNNEFMIGMANRVTDMFTTKSLAAFGPEKGLKVSLAFGRVLKTVVGLTAEGYDVASQLAFSESTGAEPALINRLIQDSVDEVQNNLFR